MSSPEKVFKDQTLSRIRVFRWYKFEEGSSRKRAVTLNERVKQVSGTLIIKEAVVADSGKYLCVVNNTVGGESVETVLTVTGTTNILMIDSFPMRSVLNILFYKKIIIFSTTFCNH